MNLQRVNSVVAAAVFSAIIPSSSASAQSQQNLNALKSGTQPTTAHMIRFLGKEIKGQLTSDEFHRQLGSSAESRLQTNKRLNDAQTTFINIATGYAKREKELDLGYKVFSGTNKLVNGAIGAGVILAPETGGVSLAVSGVAYVASKGSEQAEGMFKEAARGELRRNLKTQLERYLAETSPEGLQRLIQTKNPDEFRAELEKRVGPILGNALDSIPAEDQYIVNSFVSKEIAAVMKDGFTALSQVQQVQAQEINENRKNIIGLARTFVHYAEETSRQLDKIRQTQVDIQTDLVSLNDRVGKTEQGIEFIHEFMFGKMTASEQLNALRSGIVLDLSPQQRQDLEQKIELVSKREALINDVSGYLNGAQTIVNIAAGLEVDPKILHIASTAVQTGSAAVKAFSAFATGDYLGAVGAIGEALFGGRDIAAERHAELMNTLSSLYDRVGVIDQKIELLRKGQEQILQGLQTIHQEVFNLSQQVEANHREVLDSLRAIQGDILYNRGLILDIFDQNYAFCPRFVIDQETQRVFLNTATHQYPSYEEIERVFNENVHEFNLCNTQLQSVILRNGFHSLFYARSNDRQNNILEPSWDIYAKSTYAPAIIFLKENSSAQDGLFDRRVSSLFSPAGDINLVDFKNYLLLSSSIKSSWDMRFKLPFTVLMDQLLEPSVVAMHTKYLLDIHFYNQMIDFSNDKLYSRDVLLSRTTIPRKGYNALKDTLSLVDIAIAQQNMLGGDILLPLLYDVVQKQNITPSSENRMKSNFVVDKILANNSVLARNFILYSLRKEVLAKSNFINYDLALQSKDTYQLNAVTQQPWQFKWSDEEVKNGNIVKIPQGWSLELGEKYYSLPGGDELMEGKLHQLPDLQMLILLRARLLEEIVSYDLFNGLPAERRVRYNDAILNTL